MFKVNENKHAWSKKHLDPLCMCVHTQHACSPGDNASCKGGSLSFLLAAVYCNTDFSLVFLPLHYFAGLEHQLMTAGLCHSPERPVLPYGEVAGQSRAHPPDVSRLPHLFPNKSQTQWGGRSFHHLGRGRLARAEFPP